MSQRQQNHPRYVFFLIVGWNTRHNHATSLSSKFLGQYELRAFTPRNLMKRLSRFQVGHASFPQLAPRAQSSPAILYPAVSALFMKLPPKSLSILLTIVEINPARVLLRTVSTHFIVRSTMPLSTLDKVLNQIRCLKALVLICTRLCRFSKQRPFSSHSLQRSSLYVEDGNITNFMKKRSIKGCFILLYN